MERMKAETVMDLFQFIKAARVQRTGLVVNKVRIVTQTFQKGGVDISVRLSAIKARFSEISMKNGLV